MTLQQRKFLEPTQMMAVFAIKDESRKKYERSKSVVNKIEYEILENIYRKMKVFSYKMENLEDWFKISMQHVEATIRRLIGQVQKYRLIFRTADHTMSKDKYWGIKFAVNKCILINDYFKNEKKKFFQ